MNFNRVFHYKPSILGIPLFVETSISLFSTPKKTTTEKSLLGGSQIETTETEQLQQLCSLWHRDATCEGSGELLVKLKKQKRPKKVSHLMFFFVGVVCVFFLEGLSFFPKSSVVRFSSLILVVFFFDFLFVFLVNSFDHFWGIINSASGAATGGSFGRGQGLHWKVNNVKLVEVMWNGKYLWHLTWHLNSCLILDL